MGMGAGDMCECGQKVLTSSYKIKTPGDVMYNMIIIVNNSAYLEIANSNLKSSHHTHTNYNYARL